MLTQSQLEYLFQYLEKPFYGNRLGFEDGISLDTMNKVIEIKNNAENMNNLEWIHWYNENEKNFPVIYSALTTCLVPKNIVHKIVDKLDALDLIKAPSAGISQTDNALLKLIVANDIDTSYLEKIYNAMGMNFIFALSLDSESSSYAKPYIDKISNKTMQFLVNKTLEDFSKHSHFSLSYSRISALLAIKDESYLKTIFKGEKIDFPFEFDARGAEEIRTILINNKHLSDEFKNEMFSAGCNWLKLKYFTPEMAEEIYQSSVETYTDTYDKKTGVPKIDMSREYNNAQSMIDTLLHYDALTEPMQYDLAQRIISRESRRMDTYANELYEKTTSERVLATAVCLKSKTKESAYNNPHMPKGLIQERVEDLCKKMRNYIVKDKKEKIPDVWDDHISSGLYKTDIDKKHYDMLFWHQSFNTRMAIVLSDYTPKEIKDEIYEFLTETTDKDKLPYGYQPRIKVSMEMMNFCDKYKIDPNIKEQLKDYFKVIGPFTTSHSFYEKSGISHYHMQKANWILDELVTHGNKNDVHLLLKYCEKSAGDCLAINKQDTIPDQEKNIYKFLYLSLNQRIKDREEIEKYEETKDPKTFKTLDSLEWYLLNFKKEIIYDKTCSEYYTAIYQKGEEAYNLLMELEAREKEKEKEEEIEK